jgi:hypothetical protein
MNEHPEIFKNVDPDGDPLKKTFKLDYAATGEECYVVTDSDPIKVSQIIFDATISVKTIPYTEVHQYSSIDGDKIAQAVNFVINLGNKVVELTFLRVENN